jgi:hypothetical protein
MSDEYPEQGADSEDLGGGSRDTAPPGEHSAERTVAGGPPAAHARADGADLAAAGPPPTGDDRVDAAVAGLNRLPGTPTDEHVAVLEEVHGRLRDILGELGETPETSGEPEQR